MQAKGRAVHATARSVWFSINTLHTYYTNESSCLCFFYSNQNQENNNFISKAGILDNKGQT